MIAPPTAPHPPTRSGWLFLEVTFFKVGLKEIQGSPQFTAWGLPSLTHTQMALSVISGLCIGTRQSGP